MSSNRIGLCRARFKSLMPLGPTVLVPQGQGSVLGGHRDLRGNLRKFRDIGNPEQKATDER